MKINIDHFLIQLFSLWLLIDTINGFCLGYNIDFPLSQVYKSIVAIIVLIRCRHDKLCTKFVFILLIYLLLYSMVVLTNGYSLTKILYFLSKPITSFLFYIYFLMLIKQQKYNKYLLKIFKLSFLFFSANIVIGIFGFGFASYKDMGGIGRCGFFYAINELSVVVAVLFPISLYYVKTHCSFIFYFLFSIFLLALSFILSTKTSMLVAISSILYIMYSYGNKIEKKIVVFSIIAIIVSCITIFSILVSSDLKVFQRFSYFMDKDGLLVAFTSGRLIYWDEKSYIYYASGLITKVFGLGGCQTVEMDPLDALLNFGLLGFILIIILYTKIIYNAFKCKFYYSKAIMFSNILLVLISIFSGHLMFSSMAGMLIALSNAFLFYKNNYCLNNISHK